jgi:hypothetical protein
LKKRVGVWVWFFIRIFEDCYRFQFLPISFVVAFASSCGIELNAPADTPISSPNIDHPRVPGAPVINSLVGDQVIFLTYDNGAVVNSQFVFSSCFEYRL